MRTPCQSNFSPEHHERYRDGSLRDGKSGMSFTTIKLLASGECRRYHAENAPDIHVFSYLIIVFIINWKTYLGGKQVISECTFTNNRFRFGIGHIRTLKPRSSERMLICFYSELETVGIGWNRMVPELRPVPQRNRERPPLFGGWIRMHGAAPG